ncbi:MAG: hypothetical protein AUJ92_21025 [Armatimonadetes bacterium CG2_30_59_28]|nr:hypothetical protein [Armatimonadota bacterium]OIO89572.1 MAG: hypothetical protein AUJ92_21025 [Armatimonadetes bacterium CG2_30_59_28]PIU66370.1 MAG: hypothetical protein COS85_05115 [Armatimonadetes bacterium CG07_land_8_20_14_0_80_59_28]PIX45869.1 MAG: hypothetical protein COZ56_00910 [Armatimonadetes bacterium CG_4_8_14_3_um_filter_58_9]PIY41565.1 MAG: hypothetical protein COZ05_15515 [Armatimonadetes bacterium CG_4_10_14_3_um_filter_59_10]PJB78144.1 MAG: hypothetical protein CO095_008
MEEFIGLNESSIKIRRKGWYSAMKDLTVYVLVFTLALSCSSRHLSAEPARHSLDEYGDISKPDTAAVALQKGIEELVKAGGGILEIPPNASAALKVENVVQKKIDEPTVTIIDYRGGYTKTLLPSIGKHQTGVWAGNRLERKLNLGQTSLPHCGVYSNQAIQNYMISGASSYMLTLTDPVKAGTDVKCYADSIRGIWVGQYLTVTGKPMHYTEPYDRIVVKSIAWDKERRCNYLTADFKHDHPAGCIIYNKHVVNGMQIEGYSNCDNQSMELQVTRHHYAVGDSFVISGQLKYMSDVFCGFGDEGGVVLNAETIGEINGFHSTVEAVDWEKDEITYAPGITNPHTLSDSRPLINMNPKKWITDGTVTIVAPGGTYKGRSNPGRIGGVANVFNYQGGLILGSPDCGWTPDVVGRYFAITDPTEIIQASDPSSVGGYAQLAGRPIYRWYQIMDFKEDPDGVKIIKILRVRWSAVAAGAPKLFVDDNYTSDGHERPLPYAIAPGAWVYDISQGWADTIPTGGWVGKDAPRKIKVTPGGDRGTKLDFEAGDAIEQPPGPDPWQPRPIRIRQFDQMPSTMDNATIEVQQLGRVQVPTAISLDGIIQSVDQLKTRKDRKPPWSTAINIGSLCDRGITFNGDVTNSAILFNQPNGRAQPIHWAKGPGNLNSLQVPPSTGDFLFTGGDINLTDKGLKRTTGISATGTKANNLRGINVPVAAGLTAVTVVFSQPEADANYAVSVTPSWMTNCCVSAKSDKGFTVQMGTAAPEGARLDWVIVR